MPYLALIRHGESEWNALGLWTGWTDVNLSERGRAEARLAGQLLRGISWHTCHCSQLTRARQTLEEIKNELNAVQLPTKHHHALNERHYGELTGQNKWKIKEQYGEELFNKWRRSWDYPVPGGETLRDVYQRVVAYYLAEIMLDVQADRNVIIAAHGNSLRALVKHLDNIPDHEVASLEIATGEVHLYELDVNGLVISKEVRQAAREAEAVPQAA